MQWVVVLVPMIAGILAGAVVTRSRHEALSVPILLAGGWCAIVFTAGGSDRMLAATGLVALIPLAGGAEPGAARAWAMRLVATAAAIALLAIVHDIALTDLASLAAFVAVAATMIAFIAAGSETNRVPGVSGAQLVCVLLGIALLAADRLLWGAPVNLPVLMIGLVLGMLIMGKPFGSKKMPGAVQDATAILAAWLLGDLALQGLWVPAAILAAPAALELVVWLASAAALERGPDRGEDERACGLYVEAERRGRNQRRMLVATFLAGAVTIVLALGAARGEVVAALAGTLALMWMLQRYLWRQMPEKRST
jgi:hypothetical protein